MAEERTETFTFNKEEIIGLVYCVKLALPRLHRAHVVRHTIGGVVDRLLAAHKRLEEQDEMEKTLNPIKRMGIGE